MCRIRVYFQVSLMTIIFWAGSISASQAKGYGSLVQMDFAQRYPVTALDLALPEILEEGYIPGLSIAVIEDGEVAYCAGHGVKDTQTNEPDNEDTIFSAASLSKPVFAYAVMRLVDRGELDLDQPLAEIVPNPRLAHDPRYLEITARMVLSHTSGMPNWSWGEIYIASEPGEKFNYSGEGVCYLQQVVEQITGKSLNEVMDQEVFLPLGMNSSSYYWKDSFKGRGVLALGQQRDLHELCRLLP